MKTWTRPWNYTNAIHRLSDVPPAEECLSMRQLETLRSCLLLKIPQELIDQVVEYLNHVYTGKYRLTLRHHGPFEVYQKAEKGGFNMSLASLFSHKPKPASDSYISKKLKVSSVGALFVFKAPKLGVDWFADEWYHPSRKPNMRTYSGLFATLGFAAPPPTLTAEQLSQRCTIRSQITNFISKVILEVDLRIAATADPYISFPIFCDLDMTRQIVSHSDECKRRVFDNVCDCRRSAVVSMHGRCQRTEAAAESYSEGEEDATIATYRWAPYAEQLYKTLDVINHGAGKADVVIEMPNYSPAKVESVRFHLLVSDKLDIAWAEAERNLIDGFKMPQ